MSIANSAHHSMMGGGRKPYKYKIVAYGDYYEGMFTTPRTIGYCTNENLVLELYGTTNYIAYNSTLDTLNFVFTDIPAKTHYGDSQTCTIVRAGAGGRIAAYWQAPDLYVDTHYNDHDIPSSDGLMLSIGDVPNYNLCLLVKIEET